MSTPKTIILNGDLVNINTNKFYINGQIAITGTEDGMPYATFTTCIDCTLSPEETILDTNNIPTALKLLSDAGIVEDTGRTVDSGFCTYPIVKVL